MKQFLILIILGFNIKSYCQDFDFGLRNGLIVTQTNDTIMCRVPLTLSFGNKVRIRRIGESDEEIIPISRIKFLATETNVYENIRYHREDKEIDKLMWLELEGKLNLYLEVSTSAEEAKTNYDKKSGYTTSTTTLINTYVIKKSGVNYLIEDNKFIETIKPLIADNPELLNKIETKTYTYNNLVMLVKEYNNTADEN
jgi:hypothetical protein